MPLGLVSLIMHMEKALRNLFGESYAKVMQIQGVRKAVKDGAEFSWKENPAAQRTAEKMLGDLTGGASVLTANGVTNAYNAGVNAATSKVASQFEGKQSAQAAKVIADATKGVRAEVRTAKDSDGQNITKRDTPLLSGRVWNITDQSLSELEIIIQNGIKEGKSADDMAAEAQKYLNEPDRLFRRVLNKETGLYELSEAAKNYHPGRGVYRSAYKNALRLIRTEVNAAYRLAEWESYQKNPLVKKYRISLSGNHTTKTTSGKIVELHDICDEMAGVYDKSFKWTGWHPQCRCVMTPIVMTPAEFSAYLKSKHEGEEATADNGGGGLPEQMREWLKKNADRVSDAWAKGKLPKWMQENLDAIQEAGVVPVAEAEQAAAETAAEQQPAKVAKRVKTEEEKAAMERKAILHYGENVLRVMGGVSDETKALSDALRSGNLETITPEAKKLRDLGKSIIAKAFYVRNPLEIARAFSLKQAIALSRDISVFGLIGAKMTRSEWAALPMKQRIKLLDSNRTSLKRSDKNNHFPDEHSYMFITDIIRQESINLQNSLNPVKTPNKPKTAADIRHEQRTMEYLEDFYHRLAMRKMRQKGWGDFEASRKTFAEERAEWQGTEEELAKMLRHSFEVHNLEVPASKRLSEQEICKIISAQQKNLRDGTKPNVIKREGAQILMDDCAVLHSFNNLRYYPEKLDFWVTKNSERIAERRSELTRESIKRLPKEETETTSIQTIAGGDLTEGSCYSVSQAFAARRLGYDVIDFRGEPDADTNASSFIFSHLADLGRFRTKNVDEEYDYLLKHLKIGENYFLVVHEHASIVKKTKDGRISFLELQSSEGKGYTKNGWIKLSGPQALTYRFGDFSRSSSQLISFNDLAEHFNLLARNLETIHNTGKQMKGVNGQIK